MKRSHFVFIKDPVLKSNLDAIFDHIIELTAILIQHEATIIQSNFKKTIIVYTASITEALLLFLLKKKYPKGKMEIKKDCWTYENVKKICEINNQQVVGAMRRKATETKLCDKLSFDEINRFCLKQNIISKKTFKKVDRMRRLRNGLHIGGLKEIQKKYSNADLTFAFNTMDEVIKIAAQ